MSITRNPSPTPSLLPDPDDISDAIKDGRVDEEKLVDFVRRLNGSVALELNKRPVGVEPRHNYLLTSPSGNVYEITASDSGQLIINPLYVLAAPAAYGPEVINSPMPASVALTNISTFFFGPTLTLSPGTWELFGNVSLIDTANSAVFEAVFTKNSAAFGEVYLTNGAAASAWTSLSLSAVVSTLTTAIYSIAVIDLSSTHGVIQGNNGTSNFSFIRARRLSA